MSDVVVIQDSPSDLLSRDEIVQLDQLEQVVEAGLNTFMEVGIALGEINAKRLYRQMYHTFPEYVQERWGIAKSRAYQLIAGANTVALISSGGELPQPTNERQIRPLQQLVPERRAEAWKRAVEAAGDNEITGDMVQVVVDEMLGKVGRFQSDKFYPVWSDGKIVFNIPSAKQLWDDQRFAGTQWYKGDQLNNTKAVDGYILAELPDLNVPAIKDVLSGFKEFDGREYPIDMEKHIVYNAPFETAMRPKKLYAGCEWLTSHMVGYRWGSLVYRMGEFSVEPGHTLDMTWQMNSKFQPGMTAGCPDCIKDNWDKKVYPYNRWRAVESGMWICPSSHTVRDIDLLLNMPVPTAAPQPPATDLDDEIEDDENENDLGIDDTEVGSEADFDDVNPDDYDANDILSICVGVQDLLSLIKLTPDVVKTVLSPSSVKHYNDIPGETIKQSTIDFILTWFK